MNCVGGCGERRPGKRLMINGDNGHRRVSAYGSGYRLEQLHDAWVSPLLTVDLHP